MKRATLIQHINYKFDNLMSKGTIAPIILLFFIAFVGMVILALIIYFSGALPPEPVLGNNFENP